VVVVEGLMTLQDADILNQLDLKLFVDCRPEERVVRRIKRNMKWGETLDEITDVYLDLVRYRHDEYIEPTRWRADFVLNGSNPSELTLAMIVSWVNKQVE
jgi:uridine kinase